jgi:hypothetical protein
MALNNLIDRSDFTGRFVLAVPEGTFHETNLNQIIEQTQAEYLVLLLGAVEYAKLLADCVAGVPVNDTYYKLLFGTTYENTDGDTIIYNGFKHALIGLSYYHYVRYFGTTFTTSGNMELSGVQGNTARLDGLSKSVANYNAGVRYYATDCYDYIWSNSTEFPKWLYTKLDEMTSFIHA